MPDIIKRARFLLDAESKGMQTAFGLAGRAVENLGEEASEANAKLRAMPDRVDIQMDVDTGLLQAKLINEKRKLQESIRVDVDVDTLKASRQISAIDRELNSIDRRRVRANVRIDVDKDGMNAASSAAAGLAGSFTSIGKNGPIAAAGAVAVAGGIGILAAPLLIGATNAGLFAAATYTLLDSFDTLEKGNKRFAVVFGDQADAVDDWARTLSGRVGVGVEDLKGMASGIQDILVPLGFDRAAAADITTDLYERGAALAEFTGKDTATAIDAITKSMVGERETLKQFGIVLREEQILARAELIKGTEAAAGLDEQQLKALATMELIEEQSVDAWTAFQDGTNTAGETLNLFRAGFANFKDDTVKGLGDIAVTILDDLDFTTGMDGLKDVPGWFAENGPQIREYMLNFAEAGLQGASGVLQIAIAAASAVAPTAYFAEALLRATSAYVSFIEAAKWVLPALFPAALALPDQSVYDNAADGMQNMGDAASDMVPKLQSAADGVDQTLGSWEEQVRGLKGTGDVVLNVRANVAKGEFEEAAKQLGNLTKEEVKLILADLPEENRSSTEKKFARLARQRLADIKAEAKTIEAEADLQGLTGKKRVAYIRAEKNRSSWEQIERDFQSLLIGGTKWITVKEREGQGGFGPGDDTNGDPFTRSASPDSVTVNLDGREVATVVSERINHKHREVWV